MGGLELCTELWSIQVSLQTFLRYYLYAAVTLRLLHLFSTLDYRYESTTASTA